MRAGLLFPIDCPVRVVKLHTGTKASIGDEGTVQTAPYQWHSSPNAGPRQCVVVEIDGLSVQVRTRDLKSLMPAKGGLPT